MKKLACLYTGLLVLSSSTNAMESKIFELGISSSVEYVVPKATLEEACIQKCIDILLSEDQHATTLLQSLEGEGMKILRELIKNTLIDDYLVVLCKAFNDELPLAELEYYKKREPNEGLSKYQSVCEGVIAGGLTSDNGIVFLSYRKEGDECGAYLDYWCLADLVDNKVQKKEPRCRCKLPISYRGPFEIFSNCLKLCSEPYTNRFLISYGGVCQLWRLTDEGFEHELSFTFRFEYFKFSPDGEKLLGIWRPKGTKIKEDKILWGLCILEDIDTLKKLAIEKILTEDQLKPLGGAPIDIYDIKHPLVALSRMSSDWNASGVVCFKRFKLIQLGEIDAISLPKASVQWSQAIGADIDKLRILANGRYVLAHKSRNVWLIDMINQKAEIIASGDSDASDSVLENKLRISHDERFAILTWSLKNPFLYDLKRKRDAEIKVGNEEEISHHLCELKNYKIQNLDDLRSIQFIRNLHDLRSTYLSRDNHMLLFRLGRRIRYVCLKVSLEAKSLQELVAQIKKELHNPIENTHHHVDGEC